jgi:outer membrane lipoprotein SlyB
MQEYELGTDRMARESRKAARAAQKLRARDDVKRHAGALGGMAIGGIFGSIVPGIGTVIGMAVGGVIGHFSMDAKD